MKTKKLLTITLLSTLLCLGSCGPKHVHEADKIWHTDETQHWHECTSGDEFKMDIGEHTYGQIMYAWSNDNKCKAYKECTVCEEQVVIEEVDALYVRDTEPTCQVNEFGHFEATFKTAGLEAQKTERASYEKPDSKVDHKYGPVQYVWNDDFKCKAFKKCVYCPLEVTIEEVTGEYVKDFDATCTTNELGHLVARFVSSELETQTTEIGSTEMPGTKCHDFGATYICKKCGRTNLLNFNTENYIGEPDKLELTEELTAPDGFSMIYSYSGALGGGINTNSFFKSNLSLANYTHIAVAVLQTADNPIKFYNAKAYIQYALPAVTEDTWVTVEAFREGTVWTVTNDLGMWTNVSTAEESETYTVDSPLFLAHVMSILADSPIKLTELLADWTTEAHVHEFDKDGVCETCGYKVLPFLGDKSILRDPKLIQKTNMTAPNGYENFYFYNGTPGGNPAADGNSLVGQNAQGLTNYSELKFSVIVESGKSLGIQEPVKTWAVFNVGSPDWNEKNKIVEFTCTKKDAGTNEWIIKNSLGKFAQNGNPGNTLDEISIIPPYVNYFNYVLRLCLNSGSGVYITEILAK